MSTEELWNTEASWGDEDATVASSQASWLMRYETTQALAGVSRFVWYAYDSCDWGTLWSVSPCTDSQGTEDEINPAGAAYKVIQNWLMGANLSQCSQYQDGLWACEIKRSQGYDAWLLWSSSGQTLQVPIPSTSDLHVYRDSQNNLNYTAGVVDVDQMPILLESEDLSGQ
jgi:hypothetical protein